MRNKSRFAETERHGSIGDFYQMRKGVSGITFRAREPKDLLHAGLQEQTFH